MNKRFLLVLLSVFAILSCSQYVNLGGVSADDEAYSDYADNAPEEMDPENDPGSYDSADSADAGYDYGDTGSNDKGGDPDQYDESDSGYGGDDYASDAESGDNWDDSEPDSGEESDGGDASSPEENSLFPADFSNAECDCGSTPDYHPICCDGRILVFNACFANCYAVKTEGRICAFYKTGLCSDETGSDEENDPETDDSDDLDDDTDDGEQPDSDEDPAEIPNECGCYPEEKPDMFFCSRNNSVFYFMSFCLAECQCDSPQKIFQ